MRCMLCNDFLTKDEIAMFAGVCGDCYIPEGTFAIQEEINMDREQPQGMIKDNNPIEPNHYTDMAISPLEFIEANMDVLTWCTMNVIKYVGRHQRKNGLEDLKKAQWYLNHEIERLEND